MNRKILFSFIVLFLGINALAKQPKFNFVRGQLLCQLYDLKDTSEFKKQTIPFTINVVSESLKIIKLSYDYKLDTEHSVIQKLESQFGNIIQHIQLNHKTQLRSSTPNDSSYFRQQLFWNLIKAPEAWGKTQGGVTKQGDTIVIAMIDDGIDTSHVDIQNNLWRNRGEIPNDGLDNDNNGYIDDYFGWNSYDSSSNLITQDEEARHGTPVAGLLGADGNNAKGITGANWNVKILTVAGGSFDEAQNIVAFEYVLKMKKRYLETGGTEGAYIVSLNCSWGLGGEFPQTAPLWCGYYDSLGAYGITTVAATLNSDLDVAVVGDLPSLCPSDHLVMVTNIRAINDSKGNAAFNKDHIDLGAPGDGTYSLCPISQGGCSSPYSTFSSTSGATPVVCGLYGLIYSYGCDSFLNLSKNNPAAASLLATQFIYNGVDSNSSLKGITTTEGRVNYKKALINVEQWCQSIGQPLDSEQLVPKTELSIYPNPNNNKFLISASEEIIGYEIFDIGGALIKNISIENTLSTNVIHNFSAGIYLVKVNFKNSNEILKLQVL